MDGSIHPIDHSDSVPSVSRVKKSTNDPKDGSRKPFDPDALADEEAPDPEESSPSNHDDTPVGTKPDDESGSHLDLTA